MSEQQPERKRRKIVIDWKEDQKQLSSRRSTSGQRQSFGRSTVNIILVAVLLIVVLLGAGFVGVSSARNTTAQDDSTDWDTGERRNFNLRPRNTDIWAVYPDGSLRFVTLNYDVKPEDDQEASLVTQVAGPLLFSTEDVTERAAIGGSLDELEEKPGPGNDSSLVYELLTLTRKSYTKPYGLDVTSQSSPYVNANPTTAGDSILSLGTQLEARFKLVIVAVALPRSATITQVGDPASASSLQPYREIIVGDWQVLYFDATTASGAEAIHVYYSMIQSSEQLKLNYMKIDRLR